MTTDARNDATMPVDVHRILAVLNELNAVARGLGIEVETAAAGSVRLLMRVRPDMVNSKGTCHGGYIFLLGDQAAGWACMTHNEQAVTQSAHITYVAAAELDDDLLADAEELTKSRRAGTYDVRVTTRAGRLVALVRCAYAIIGPAIIEA
jgi:acyl-CoA thioesterase